MENSVDIISEMSSESAGPKTSNSVAEMQFAENDSSQIERKCNTKFEIEKFDSIDLKEG